MRVPVTLVPGRASLSTRPKPTGLVMFMPTNRDAGGCVLRGQGAGSAVGYNHIGFAMEQLLRQL